MQEIISQIVARVQAIFSQLGDQVRAAMENAAAGKAILAALDVILPVASGVLRILAVFVAILIIVRCCRSIFREKPGKEIWGWLTLADGATLVVYGGEGNVVNTTGPGWSCATGKTPSAAESGPTWTWTSPPFPAATPPSCGTTRATGPSSPCKPKTAPASTAKK